ncbi:MAG: LCP family protein [Selenomonadaceae bacterium]|nr:LCP family protein [Selenomonadaceae bacterium]
MLSVKRDYSRIQKLFAIVLLIAASIIGIVMDEKYELPVAEKKTAEKIVNVIVLGVDRRSDDTGRSDTMMIVSYDENNGTATLFSVPRDTRVKYKNDKYDKINHAYAYGGYKESIMRVEELFDAKINHYILVDQRAFPKIIDAMGGLLLDVDKRMYYEDPWDDDGLVIDLYPGEQFLDGNRAIQYVRYRDDEGDIGRIKRQQKFVKAVLEELMSAETLPKLPDILRIAANSVETDLEISEMLSLADVIKSVYEKGLKVKTISGRPAYYEGISYYIPNISELRKDFKNANNVAITDEFLAKAEGDEKSYNADIPKGMKFDETPPATDLIEDEDRELKPEDIKVSIINDSGINGAAAKAAEILAAKGFIIVKIETGDRSDRETSTFTIPKDSEEMFTPLPFKCEFTVGKRKREAFLHIGLDFKE